MVAAAVIKPTFYRKLLRQFPGRRWEGPGFLNGASQLGPGGLPGLLLGASLTPNQTIPTIILPRLSNTVVSQLDYQLSPRSSWTVSASFGTLNFLGANYINSTDELFQTGYNYLLSPESSIAVIYRFDAFRFANISQGFQDHVVELGYGRYINRTLSLHLPPEPRTVKRSVDRQRKPNFLGYGQLNQLPVGSHNVPA